MMDILKFLGEIFADFWSDLIDFLKRLGKWIVTRLIRFGEHIVSFLHGLRNKLQGQPNLKAISVNVSRLMKDKNNYNVVNLGLTDQSSSLIVTGLFDTSKEEFVKEDSIGIDHKEEDDEVKEKFGNKAIVVYT